MKSYHRRILDAIRPIQLFNKPAHLRFAPKRSTCLCCNQRLLVRRSHRREVVILDTGSFTAEETQLYCPTCIGSPVVRSEGLQQLVSSGAKYGYDVMVFAGRATFQRHRTAEEVVEELFHRNVSISPSEVRIQARRFVVYLAQVHHESQDSLKELLNQQGGYILHLDGTCDGASSHLLSKEKKRTPIKFLFSQKI